MLLDLFSLSVGGFIGVVMGFTLCLLWLLVKGPKRSFHCSKENCDKACPDWEQCVVNWHGTHEV